MLFALAPALEASRADLATALKENDRAAAGSGRTLGALVVSEVALAVLLLSASGLLIESFARIQSRRTGFVADNVLTFWVRPPGSRYPRRRSGPATVERLLTRIQSVPGVESAAVNRCTPFSGCSRTIAVLPDRPADRSDAPGVGRHYVSADYFRDARDPAARRPRADRGGSRGQPAGRRRERNRGAPLLARREPDRQACLVRDDDRTVLRSAPMRSRSSASSAT